MIASHAHQINEIFNDINNNRHDSSFYSCNIYAINYFKDYIELNNHMFDVHQIDIRLNMNKKHKRYVN